MIEIDTASARLDLGPDPLNGNQLMDLPLSKIKPDSEQPRRHFDPETLDDLAQSMAMIGQLQPIGVRRDGSSWVLIYGERRWRAAGLLGWKTVQGREYKPLGPAKLVLQACENMHRDELTLDEYATTVLRLVEVGMPIEAVARALGRREAWAQSMLAIARDPVARAMIAAGRLSSVGAWEQFMAMRPAERKSVLDDGRPVTGPRCERAKERAERAQAAKQRGLGLIESDVNEKPEVGSVQTCQAATPDAQASRRPSYFATIHDGEDPAAAVGEEKNFPLPLPLAICLWLVPLERELIEFWRQWDPLVSSASEIADASAKLDRLRQKLIGAIVAMVEGQREVAP